jgi:hypothetical protein
VNSDRPTHSIRSGKARDVNRREARNEPWVVARHLGVSSQRYRAPAGSYGAVAGIGAAPVGSPATSLARRSNDQVGWRARSAIHDGGPEIGSTAHREPLQDGGSCWFGALETSEFGGN